MNAPDNPELGDGVIFLRPLTAEDAPAHLAGEDDEMARWLSGGRSTMATVQAYIERSRKDWLSGAPRKAFGIFHCASRQLIGSIEVRQLPALESDQLNVSYGVFPPWRGQGIAVRAINLIDGYLKATTSARQMVLRIPPANTTSIRVAEKAGFTSLGMIHEPDGLFARYVRDIR